MKIRNGFVSNSSSSSFIIFVDNELNTKEDIRNNTGGNHSIGTIKSFKRMKKALNTIKTLYKENLINEDQKKSLLELLNGYSLHEKGLFFWENDETIDFEYTPNYKITNQLYKSLVKGKDLQIEYIDNHPQLERRVLYKIGNWKEKLNKGQYLYNVLYNNFLHQLRYTDIFNNDPFSTNISSPICRELETITWNDKNNNELLKSIAEKMTNIEINNILDRYSDNVAYIIDYCTDDGVFDNIDSIMRSNGEEIFRYCNYVIRHEKS